jgi:hypothetical protein
MGNKGFIPEIWSGSVLLSLKRALILANLFNNNYEGEVKFGNVLKINSPGEININDYSGSITDQDVEPSQQELKIDKQLYFSFLVDEIEAAQANVSLMNIYTQDAGYRLAKKVDTWLAEQFAAQAKILVTNSGSAYSVTSSNILSVISIAAQKLDEADVPDVGRYLVLCPWAWQKAGLAKITLDTNNSDTLANGFKGKLLGFDIYTSNSLVIGTPATNTNCKMIFGYNESATKAMQINKVETLPHASKFKSIVRGLNVLGCKVVRPEASGYIYATYAAES